MAEFQISLSPILSGCKSHDYVIKTSHQLETQAVSSFAASVLECKPWVLMRWAISESFHSIGRIADLGVLFLGLQAMHTVCLTHWQVSQAVSGQLLFPV